MKYKERVPVCGAVLINEWWDKVRQLSPFLASRSPFGLTLLALYRQVLLVKGWTKGSAWSFPRGKINKQEPEAMCAVREVRRASLCSRMFTNSDALGRCCRSAKRPASI